MTNKEFLTSEKVSVEEKRDAFIQVFDILTFWNEIWSGNVEENVDDLMAWFNMEYKNYALMSPHEAFKDFCEEIKKSKEKMAER